MKWNNELSVGNGAIDTEHKVLILFAQNISDAIRKRQLDSLEEQFAFIEVLLQRHFLTEEKLALAANYEFSEHKCSHQSLLSEIVYLRNELIGKKEWSNLAAMHYCNILESWLYDHIIKEDMLMKPALSALPS